MAQKNEANALDIVQGKVDKINDLHTFKSMSDIMVTYRFVAELIDVKEKVYSKDTFGHGK